MSTKNQLSVVSWNIRGISSRGNDFKLNDDSVSELLKQYDIIGLVETHTVKKHENNGAFSLSGYTLINHGHRPVKKVDTLKNSGGVALLIKDSCLSGISPQSSPSKSCDFTWIRLKKEFFGWKDDYFLGLIYISPKSQMKKLQIPNLGDYDKLMQDCAYFSSKGKVMLMGDFNARTKEINDFILNDEVNDGIIPSSLDYEVDSAILPRKNMDTFYNSYGSDLLNICTSSGLRILNGRTCGDTLGKFTCQEKNGCSTVDYALVHQSILSKIYTFRVIDWSDISWLSDHSPISLTISMSTYFEKEKKIMINKLKNQFIWNDEISKIAFCNGLKSPSIRAAINSVDQKLDNEDIDLDSAVKDLSDIIINVSQKCLKSKVIKQRKKKKNAKNWFNNRCIELYKTCKRLSHKLDKSPYDRELRDSVYKKVKEYKKLCRRSKRKYRNMIFEKLNELHEKDPNSYWKLFNKLKEGTQSEDIIEPSLWQNHYTKLLGTKFDESSDHDKQIISNLNQMESEKHFSELDFSITQNEVRKAIDKLKNKKSPGIDGILNEMLKCSSETLTPTITKLFNKLLCNGLFPKYWSHGLISSIFKDNNPKDPSNYRGLTLCSCFGKLFTSVLNSRLYKFMKDRNLLSKEQIGFKIGTRTSICS